MSADPQFTSTIAQTLSRSAQRFPDRIALTFEDRSWTYAELDAAVGRVARRLLDTGLVHGDRVAAYGKNSDAYLLTFLGCLRAGLVHVPINFNVTGEELAYHLEQSTPAALFGDVSLADRLDGLVPTGVEVGTFHGGGNRDILAWAQDASIPPHPESEVGDDDLAQILYTSGTTSRPKGAMLSHRALLHEYL